MKARYLLLFTSLCAVPQFAKPQENVIAAVRATQSTTYPHYGDANNAIDGNFDTELSHSSCSCTGRQCRPWWRVDLQKHYRIFVVNVTNVNRRADRLNGAEIRIGDSLENNGNNNTLCAKINYIPTGKTDSFYCEPAGAHGRYLNIFLPRCGVFLTLCEVQAFGAHDPH